MIVEKRTPPSAAFDIDFDFARVGRALLPAAVDLGVRQVSAKKKRVPHFSRPLRKVGTTTVGSIAFDFDVDFARVGRTLLSDAFDLRSCSCL
jgi:hypothetical protein